MLHRPGLARYINAELRADLLGQFRAVATFFVPAMTVTDCRDSKDNKYLELALAAEATNIVSSDDDLLVLNPWRGVRILLPAAYLYQGALTLTLPHARRDRRVDAVHRRNRGLPPPYEIGRVSVSTRVGMRLPSLHRISQS